MRLVAVVTCVIAACFAFSLGTISYLAFERADDQAQRQVLEDIRQQFELGMSGAGRMVMAQADMIAGLPGVSRGLATHNREEVLARLLPSFPAIRSQFSIDLLVAADRTNKVVARAHEPDRFGDDMSKTRPMVVQANVTGAPQNGLEVGTTGLRMRAVVPVLFEGDRVGSFEVGQRIDRIIDNLRRVTGADIGLLLNREAASSSARAGDQRPVLGNLTGEIVTNPQLFSEIAQHLPFSQVKEPTVDRLQIGEHVYAVLQFAVSDYGGQSMGNFVAAKDVNENTRFRHSVLARLMTISALGALAIVSLILIVFRGLVIRPVSAAATQAEALARGEAVKPLPPMRGRSKLARLYAALEKLRLQKAGDAS